MRARARSFPLEICLAIELFVYGMGAVPSAEWTVRGRPGYRVASFRFSGLRHGHRTVAEHDKNKAPPLSVLLGVAFAGPVGAVIAEAHRARKRCAF